MTFALQGIGTATADTLCLVMPQLKISFSRRTSPKTSNVIRCVSAIVAQESARVRYEEY